jgi:hypothetical protein
MFHHQETYFPQKSVEGRWSELSFTVSGCHGARRHGSCANRRSA